MGFMDKYHELESKRNNTSTTPATKKTSFMDKYHELEGKRTTSSNSSVEKTDIAPVQSNSILYDSINKYSGQPGGNVKRRLAINDIQGQTEALKLTRVNNYYNSIDADSLTAEVAEYEKRLSEKEALENELASMRRNKINARVYPSEELSQKTASVQEQLKAYSDVDKDTLAQKKQLLHQVTNKKAYEELLSVVNNADFEHYSNIGKGIKESESDDYRFLIRNPKTNETAQDEAQEYELMTDEEKAVYHYYLGKGDRESAEKLLETLETTLNTKRAEARFETLEGKTAREILFGIESGIDQFSQGVLGLGNMIRGEDDFIAPSSTQILSGLVREDLKDDTIPIWYNFKEGEWEDKVLGASAGQLALDALTTTSNMMPSILASAVVSMVNPVAGAVTGATLMGASASGNAYQEVLNLGYDKDSAKAYATAIGVSEASLQYLLGGIGKLGGTSAKITKAVSGIDNGLLRFSLEYGGKLASEGLEEGLQEVLNPIFKNAILGTDENVNWGEVAYAALLGALVGGTLGGKPSSSNYTANEQTVINKEIENRIAEQETDGKKLTKREKSAIEKQVRKDLEKGYISIDTIESALGGDTYKGYTSLTERKAELEKAIKEIEDMPYNSLTVKQSENLKAMREDLNTVNEHLQTSKGKLSENVFNLTEKDTFLRESYAEKERSGQSFTADTTQYKSEYARKTVENIVNSGLMNNTRQAHEFTDFAVKIAEDKQMEIDLTTTAQLEQMQSDRIKAEKNGEVYTGKFNITADPESIEALVSKKHRTMLINMDSKRSLISLVGHEITHTMEGNKDSYNKLQKALFKYAETKGELQSRRTRYESLYKGLNANIDMELTADLVGDYVMTDSDFIRNLSTEEPNLFKRIYEEIKYMFKLATAGSREARELERVKKAFEEIYRESTANMDGDTKLSLSKVDGTAYVKTEKETFLKEDGTMASEREVFKALVGKKLILSDGEIEIVNRLPKKDMYNELARRYPKKLGNVESVKSLNSDVNYNMKELLENSEATSLNEADREGKHKEQGIVSFDTRTVNFFDGEKAYEIQFSIATLQDGKKVAYAKKFFGYDTELTKKIQTAEARSKQSPLNQQSAFENSVPQNSEKSSGDTKYSLTDSNGRRLTKEQQNYFKNSKARDKNGNLMVVYHGSKDYGFTVFDTSKADDNMSLFFTNSKDMANSYVGDKSKLYETYLNLENPYIVDAKGHRWNQIRLGENTDAITGKVERFVDLAMRYDVEIDFALVSENLGSMTDSVDYMLQEEAENLDEGETSLYTDAEKAELRQLASEIDEAYENWDEEAHLDEDGEPMSMPVYLLDHKLSTKYTTRQIAKIAKEQGNDGVIIENVNDNGKFTSETGVHGFGNVYIAFNPNQIKNVDNTNPTSDPDIRFSLTESVEETRDLMAIHNLSGAKLLKSLKLGGLPMPSIAITKEAYGHEGFGDISLIFSKDSIDPKMFRSNKVYSGDAWTPTYPQVSHKLNEKEQVKIKKKIDSLVPYDMQYQLGGLHLDETNMSHTLDRYNGDMVDYYKNDTAMKYAYLIDSGKTIDLPRKTARLSTTFDNDFIIKVAEHYGEDFINDYNVNGVRDKDALIFELRNMANTDAMEYYGDEPVLKRALEKNPMYTEKNFGFAQTDNLLRAAFKYFRDGLTTEVDTQASRGMISENTNQQEYEKWLADLFANIVEKTGIRNNKDLFTPSGNRRSWDVLHYEETLENVIRAMKEDGEKGIGALGGNIFGAATEEFSSIGEIKEASKKLQNMTHDEWVDSKKEFQERFTELASSLPNNTDSFTAIDSAAETLVEAVSKYKTREGIARYLKKELAGWAKYSEQTVDELIELVNDIRNMPVNYFEAKPQRAVGFDEVGVFVIPYDADVKLKQELLNRGYSIAEYDPKIEGDRKRVVNQFEEYKFSLGNVGEKPRVYGSYNIFAKDIRKDIAPTADNFEQFKRDYAPLTETEANLRDDTQIKEHYFLDDMTPEAEEIYNGTFATHAEPSDPFYERDIKDVGKRDVKAYMYEHPEVKPFFQQEAIYMLGELENSTKGERQYNDQLYYDTNGEMGFFGTTRETSDEIAYLLDNFHYTYKDIEKGLKAIIEDNGKENNAISKRIEFLLDERLRKGYTDFVFGDKIEPNQEYINLLFEKEIATYDDESWNNWLRNLTEDEINHLSGYDVAPTPKGYVPIEPEQPKIEAPLPEMFEDKGGQLSMMETQEAPKTLTRKALHENIINNAKQVFDENGFDLDEVFKNAKNLSTFATVDNIPQRVMEKALGYKEGQILSDITVNKVAQNETEGIKWLNSYTDRKNGLLAELSRLYNIKPGSKKSAAAQMYAEGFYVNENNEIIKYGDAELAQDFPNPKEQRDIKGLASDSRIRAIYDETLEMINASRTRNAYPEIPRLDNYFLHFRAMDDTFSKLGLPFNPNDIRAKDLPTDLNGVTADLKPGQPYFASAMHRTGKRTSFDLLGGLERYLTSAKNQIYHIDDIQTLRAIRNYIADTYGQANGLSDIDSLSEEEAQDRIERVFNAHLSTFAKFLNEEANILAGKTALIDRGLEGIIGRRGITFLNTVNGQVGSNMVGYNISSSLTNILPVVQTFAKTNKADFVKAFAQTVSNKVGSVFGRNDGFAEQSPVMIRRKGSDRFYRTPFQKLADPGYALMGAVDSISTELIARTKYNELTRKGMDSQQAHYETDKWVSRLMGDRSIGQMPQLYNSKMLGLVTKFQLEVRNQLDSQFYDTIQDAKVSNEHIENGLARNAKIAAKVGSTFVQLAVAQHLFGKAFESVAGYNPSFDIIEVLMTVFGFDDEEDSEDTVLDNIEQGFLALLEDLPYTSTFTGGRIPISSALPIEELVTGKDEYGNEKSRLKTISEIAPYYILPGGYGQIKKTKQGLNMFDDDLPISGSYTDSGNLRFPIEDTPTNRIQAAIFGQWASENARDYFDNNRSPLKQKQIEEFIEVDLPIRDYWEYREGLSGLASLSEKADYINSLDLPIDKKNILINNQTDRKEPIDLTGYENYNSFEEFEYAKENPGKHAISKAVGDYEAYVSYLDVLNDIRADKDSSGKTINGSAKEKKKAYIFGLNLDYGQKVILYRSLYDSTEDKNKYNADIVEYLDSRNDISWEEMKTILEELGMKVYSDGRVEW